MKLIIDIDEEDYNDIITCNPEVETEYVLDLLMKCVDNGIPFEQIRDEIADLDMHYDNDHFSGNDDAMFKCDDVLQIIDKHR